MPTFLKLTSIYSGRKMRINFDHVLYYEQVDVHVKENKVETGSRVYSTDNETSFNVHELPERIDAMLLNLQPMPNEVVVQSYGRALRDVQPFSVPD